MTCIVLHGLPPYLFALTSHGPSHDPKFTLLQPPTLACFLFLQVCQVPSYLRTLVLAILSSWNTSHPHVEIFISHLDTSGILSFLPVLTSVVLSVRSSLTTLFKVASPLWHLLVSSLLYIYFTYLFCLLSISLHWDVSFMLIGYFFTPEFPAPGIVLGLWYVLDKFIWINEWVNR